MSDGAEKSFEATPSRIAKARREGNVARSQEIAANAAFIAAAGALALLGPVAFAAARRAIVEAAGMRPPLAACVMVVGCALLVIAAASAGGAVAGVAQSGGLAVVAPSFKLERLAPAEGLKRMLSRETAMHALRASFAFVVASAAIATSMRGMDTPAGAALPVSAIASGAVQGTLHVIFACAAVGLLFAIFEYASARKTWLAKLRMSLHDLKRELKENDGDPLLRQRRKAIHRSFIRGSLAKVKDASFVVVNPTHVAVALQYRPPEVPVPLVLVRAAEEMALRVRAAATEAKIPVIEDVALARALFAQSEVGQSIPAEHFVAVAEIVASLIRSGAL